MANKVDADKLRVDSIEAQQTHALRQKVLLPHLQVEDCWFSNDTSSGSFHLGAYVGDQLVGVASFYPEINESILYSGKNPYRLRQMGILPEFQKMGVARKLLDTGIAYLQMKSCEVLWCQARKMAYPFYEKMGFQYQGEVFEIPEIGAHRLMCLDLPPMD